MVTKRAIELKMFDRITFTKNQRPVTDGVRSIQNTGNQVIVNTFGNHELIFGPDENVEVEDVRLQQQHTGATKVQSATGRYISVT
jgi:hypothetical protein